MKKELEEMNPKQKHANSTKSLNQLNGESGLFSQAFVSQSTLLNSLAEGLKSIESSQSLSELTKALKELKNFTSELSVCSNARLETFWMSTKQYSQDLLKTINNLNNRKIVETLEEWKSRTDVPMVESLAEKEMYYNTCVCCKKEIEKSNGLVLKCNHFVDRDCLVK